MGKTPAQAGCLSDYRWTLREPLTLNAAITSAANCVATAEAINIFASAISTRDRLNSSTAFWSELH
jgi:hypothetical protein